MESRVSELLGEIRSLEDQLEETVRKELKKHSESKERGQQT